MSLPEAPERSLEREPPQTVGEAVDIIEAGLSKYPRIWQTLFVGDESWNVFLRNKSKSLSDQYSGYSRGFQGSVPFRFFFGQYLVNFVCRNLLTEFTNGKVCLTTAIGRIPEMRHSTPQDNAEILDVIQFILGFAQIDLGLPVMIKPGTNVPFVSLPRGVINN